MLNESISELNRKCGESEKHVVVGRVRGSNGSFSVCKGFVDDDPRFLIWLPE